MKARRLSFVPWVLVGVLLMLASCDDCSCPGELNNAEYGTAADGETYRVLYHYLKSDDTPDFVDANGNGQLDPGESFGSLFCPQAHAVWIRDAAVQSHDLLIAPTYAFQSSLLLREAQYSLRERHRLCRLGLWDSYFDP